MEIIQGNKDGNEVKSRRKWKSQAKWAVLDKWRGKMTRLKILPDSPSLFFGSSKKLVHSLTVVQVEESGPEPQSK